MKQNYIFSLVCLCFLLTSQIISGQSLSHKADLPVHRIRSSGYYGNKSDKASVTASTPVDNTAPTAPANLVAEVTEHGVVLSWGASTDNFGVVKYMWMARLLVLLQK
jgi:hypothetical protein